MQQNQTKHSATPNTIAVIFEVTLRPAGKARYLQLASELANALGGVDGFISIERFQSLSDESRLLSLSFWRDEAAVLAWKSQHAHQAAQQEGQQALFSRYRIRVAAVLNDYGNTAA